LKGVLEAGKRFLQPDDLDCRWYQILKRSKNRDDLGRGDFAKINRRLCHTKKRRWWGKKEVKQKGGGCGGGESFRGRRGSW